MGILDHSQLAYLYIQSDCQIWEVLFLLHRKEKQIHDNLYRIDWIFESLLYILWLAYKPCFSLSWLLRAFILPGLLTYIEITWRFYMSGTYETNLSPHVILNYDSKMKVFYYCHFIDRCHFQKTSITLFVHPVLFKTLDFFIG